MSRVIVIPDEALLAARAVLSAGLDAAGIVAPQARAALETVVLFDVLSAAFKAAQVDVNADTVTITDERPG